MREKEAYQSEADMPLTAVKPPRGSCVIELTLVVSKYDGLDPRANSAAH